jgi:hypothetical protein
MFLAFFLCAHPETRMPNARVASRYRRWGGHAALVRRFPDRFKLFKLQFRRDKALSGALESYYRSGV